MPLFSENGRTISETRIFQLFWKCPWCCCLNSSFCLPFHRLRQLVSVAGIYSDLLHFSMRKIVVVAKNLHSICSQLLEVRRLENCDRFYGHSQIAHECWWQLRSDGDNDDESPLNSFRNVCRAPRQLIFALINSESRRRMIIMILL